MSDRVPAIGSSEFLALDFRQQLEIKALQLFNPDEYLRRVEGEQPFLNLKLGLPENPSSPPLEDFPVAVIKDYWAAYLANFKEKWYITSKGYSPLDPYGIEYKKAVSVSCFTFPLMALDKVVYLFLCWVAEHYFRRNICGESLLDACKMYAWVATPTNEVPLRREWNKRSCVFEYKPDTEKVFLSSLHTYQGIATFDELNEEFPLIEPCTELEYLECEEFLVLHQAQYRFNRYVYPVLPADLYSHPYFKVRGWGFIS